MLIKVFLLLQVTQSHGNCDICCESYDTETHCPHLLTCGHCFCRSCLSTIKDGETIRCPYCKFLTIASDDIHKLPKNFALLELLDKIGKY